MALTTVSNAGLGGSIDLTAKVTGTLPIANGGTNSTSTTFVNAASNVTGTLPVGNGGSGRTAATGNVLQVVSSYDSTPYFTTTSSSMQTTDITVTITPSATSSKILLIISYVAGTADGDASQPVMFLRQNVGGAGDAGVISIDDITGYNQNSHNSDYIGASYLHSPSTTSEIVYYVQLASRDNSTTAIVGDYYGAGNKGGSTITALEIAG